MTPSEMLTLLGYRLEDPNGDKYDNTLKVLMINRAQSRVYTELNQHVVPELREVESDVALSSGAFDASDLTYSPLGGLSGGVIGVLVDDDYFTNKISFEEYRNITNRSITFTYSNPKHYFLGSKCYVLPDYSGSPSGSILGVADNGGGTILITTDGAHGLVGGHVTIEGTTSYNGTFAINSIPSSTTLVVTDAYVNSQTGTFEYTDVVDVYYKRQPLQITVADYDTQSFTPESELVHDAVAYMAESMLWAVNNDPRENKALEQAALLIETLNTTISATESNNETEDDLHQYSDDYILPIGDTWDY